MISESLSKKCAAKINMLKPAVLGKNATIYIILLKKVIVVTGDTLIEFTSSFEDPDTQFLQAFFKIICRRSEINYHETITAKYTGKITKIDIFYNCPFEELSPSLQKSY